MSDEKNVPLRTGKELLRAMRPFAKESRVKSWWHLGSTFGILGGLLAAAALLSWWPLRAVAAVLAGLMIVRGFIVYHDFMHRAILRKSRLAKVLLYSYGVLVLTPPRSWRRSHNFHHANVGKIAAGRHDASPSRYSCLLPGEALGSPKAADGRLPGGRALRLARTEK